jgi:hypothetical protein
VRVAPHESPGDPAGSQRPFSVCLRFQLRDACFKTMLLESCRYENEKAGSVCCRPFEPRVKLRMQATCVRRRESLHVLRSRHVRSLHVL